MPTRHRRAALRSVLSDQGLDALIVSHAANRYYLSHFELHDPQCNESAGWIVVTAQGRDWLLTDPRYTEAAKQVWPAEDLFVYTGKRNTSVSGMLRDLGLETIGFEARSLDVETFQELSRDLNLRPTTNLVENLRLSKDTQEIECLRQSCKLNHFVFESVEAILQPGRTEAWLSWQIEKLFRENGATELAFATIAAVGPNAALPHAIPGETPITEQCPVLIDTGGRKMQYCSDQTRTFWVGQTPSQQFLQTRERVQEAQHKAIEAIAPGMPVKDLYTVAKETFRAHGQEDYFTHALGHGIGLETHEAPSLSPYSEHLLQPGMVITIEPGLYYREWGGVRWEHMVLVTDNGAEVL